MEYEPVNEVKVPMLRGSDDYFEWADRMRFAMLAKPELWWVVTGEFRRPEMRNDEVTKTRSSSADDKLARQLKHWEQRNGQALSLHAALHPTCGI
ncbi:uncharacterized protein UMAG_11079 [Mycosarcoma maydis]|uniref:Uncharacterized protein n=1 Tax=Mycosarcoma maydis TaxID=5270 RepID=A0A0D1DVM5_MYCMD|nr:uncharacterized protein UMAG_11079 [Ustilago maydis 521]KIS68334.1 hypothetical protein UMAG_11079 [Ustilago maydis 521]|eukprot:XP_011390086.1 hypothetical protein UMAG_11079 [Ustilago maydis 521]